MEIQIQAVKFKADEKLVEFIERKLEKIASHLATAIKAEVILKVDKEHAFDNKIAEIRVHIPGNDLFAAKQLDSFEAAVDDCVDAIRKQMDKLKK